MSASVRIELNSAGIRELLRSPEVLADLERRARNIADAADAKSGRAGDHGVKAEAGKNRARAVVFTDTFNAMHSEATDRTLIASLDAGRT